VAARCSVSASDEVAVEAAEDASLAGLSPLKVALAGYLAAAGHHPGVLLSSAAILVHGLGVSRSFDGRLRQPGIGIRRPRGFVKGEPVPDSAYVTAPQIIPAMYVALGYDEDRRSGELFKAALSNARRAGASRRVALLTRIKELGARTFVEPSVNRHLLHLAAPAQGGQLAAKDFEPLLVIDVPAVIGLQKSNDTSLEVPVADFPWARAKAPRANCEPGYISAVDRRGVGVLVCYERAVAGVEVAELDLLAPLAGIPTLRGVTRVPPGQALPFFWQSGLLLDQDGNAKGS
jgi:hypothetical protein